MEEKMLGKDVGSDLRFEIKLSVPGLWAGYFPFSWEDKYLMIAFLYFSKSRKFR